MSKPSLPTLPRTTHTDHPPWASQTMATTAPVLVAALALLAGTPDELAKRFAHHYEGPARASLAQSISPARSHSPPVGSVEPAGAQPLWPQMVHMSLTGRPGEAVIEWVSGAPPNSSVVQLSAEPGCCDSPECPCFPCACSYDHALILSPHADLRSLPTDWCWRRNHTGQKKGTGAETGKLLQNVTEFAATDWFYSGMPRTPQGEPAFNARDAAVAKDIDQRFMDVEANPAALNYTLHQALVTTTACRRLFSLACVSHTNAAAPDHRPRPRPDLLLPRRLIRGPLAGRRQGWRGDGACRRLV